MDYTTILRDIILPCIPIFLILTIINGIFKYSEFKTKLLVNIISGLILFLFLSIALIIDFTVFEKSLKELSRFIMFPVAALIWAVVSFIYYFKKIRNNPFQGFRRYTIRTVREDNNHDSLVIDIDTNDYQVVKEEVIKADDIVRNVYVIMQYKDKLILRKDNNLLKGFEQEITTKVGATLEEIIKKYEVTVNNTEYIGEVVEEKKQTFCYLIDLESYQTMNDNIVIINKYDLNDYQIPFKDKELILRILIKEPFKIEK